MFELTTLETLSWLITLGVLAITLKSVSFGQFLEDKKTQHLVLGGAVSIFALWLFRVGITQGLEVHFLWLTSLTLLLGWRWSLLSGFLAVLGTSLAMGDPLSRLGVNALLGVFLPVSFSYLVYSFSFHKLPRHFFVYIFICSFLTGALAIALKMFALGSYYYLDGLYDWQTISDTYLMLIPLLLFSDGMLNGMTMTLLVIYRPQWVYTFYDKFYLQDK